MASRLLRLVPHDACALYLKHGDMLKTRFVGGERAEHCAEANIKSGDGLSGWVAQHGKPILNGNTAAELACTAGPDGFPRLRCALSIPLFDLEEEVFGVLTLYATRPDSFQRDHLRILQAMEAKLSLSLMNALQYRRTETNAETDFLTGLPNARRLFLRLAADLEKSRDSNACLAVAVCDLNSFKDVNDRRGHLAGNRLLSLIAEEFRQVCTDRATVARMGGDEFVFLMPGVDEQQSDEWLTAIAEAVSSASRRAGAGIKVSASIGAAFFPEDGSTAEEILSLADRRMYLDKQFHYGGEKSSLLDAGPDTRKRLSCVQ